MHVIHPDLYTTDKCRHCDSRATLEHILWGCPDIINNSCDAALNSDSLRARWESALLSSDLEQQLWAVQRAEEAAKGQQPLAEA